MTTWVQPHYLWGLTSPPVVLLINYSIYSLTVRTFFHPPNCAISVGGLPACTRVVAKVFSCILIDLSSCKILSFSKSIHHFFPSIYFPTGWVEYHTSVAGFLMFCKWNLDDGSSWQLGLITMGFVSPNRTESVIFNVKQFWCNFADISHLSSTM